MRTGVHLVMFDIDGTLVESYDFDSICFVDAVHDVLGVRLWILAAILCWLGIALSITNRFLTLKTLIWL